MPGFLKENAQKASLAVAAIVFAVAVYSIGWYIYSPLTRPSLSDYSALSAYIHREWKDGDVVAVVPFWAERIREYAGDLKVINPRDPAVEDLSLKSRLWLLSVFGYAKKGDLLGRLGASYKLVSERVFGKLTLYEFALPPPAKISFDFLKSLDRARVFVDRDSNHKDCQSWRDGGWRCPGNGWEYVGPETLDIDDNPRRCLWAHPTTNGWVSVEYKGVPLSKRIAGHTGFTYAATRMTDGAPVTLEVFINGKKVLTHVNENRKGWNRFEADTSSLAGSTGDVLFRVFTRHDGMRHFCFDALATD